MSTWTSLIAWTNKVMSITRLDAYLGTSGNLQYLKDRLGIGVRVCNSGDLTIPVNTQTDLTFDTERWDSDGMHSLAGNTERLTCVTPGKYLIIGNIAWEANAAGRRAAQIYLNGATIIGSDYRDVGELMSHRQIVTTIYDLGVGDYVTLSVYQFGTGGDLDVLTLGNYSPEFMAQWIGE